MNRSIIVLQLRATRIQRYYCVHETVLASFAVRARLPRILTDNMIFPFSFDSSGHAA